LCIARNVKNPREPDQWSRGELKDKYGEVQICDSCRRWFSDKRLAFDVSDAQMDESFRSRSNAQLILKRKLIPQDDDSVPTPKKRRKRGGANAEERMEKILGVMGKHVPTQKCIMRKLNEKIPPPQVVLLPNQIPELSAFTPKLLDKLGLPNAIVRDVVFPAIQDLEKNYSIKLGPSSELSSSQYNHKDK